MGGGLKSSAVGEWSYEASCQAAVVVVDEALCRGSVVDERRFVCVLDQKRRLRRVMDKWKGSDREYAGVRCEEVGGEMETMMI